VNAVMHDTLAISERLKQAGLAESAAKAVAMEIVSTVEVQAATKADVREIVHTAMDELRKEMADLRKDIHNEMMDLRKEMWHIMMYTLGAMTLLLVAFGIGIKVLH